MVKCSCGKYFYHRATDFTPYQNLDNEPHGWYDENANEGNNFCPSCGDQLLPGGRVIQRESVPNRLMFMLREVQATCPENGLQEFALRCLNWIEGYINENDENIICSHHRFEEKAGVPLWTIRKLEDNPGGIKLKHLFRLLNAAQKAQEAK